MKTLRKIVLVLIGLIVLLIIVAYLLPRHIHVERSAVIPAAQEVVFNQVNILKNWEDWSSWHTIDPEMEIIYEGPEMGVGASYSWVSSNPQAGSGKLTIVESIPFSRIETELDFMEQGTGTTVFTFSQVQEGTLMNWSMETDMGNNPIARYIGLFMDKWLGNDFEKGMANIKEVIARIPEPETDME